MTTEQQQAIQYLFDTDASFFEMRDAIVGGTDTTAKKCIWQVWKDDDVSMINSYFVAFRYQEQAVMERMAFYMALCGWSDAVREYIHHSAEEYQALRLSLDDAIERYGKQWQAFMISHALEQEKCLDTTIREVWRMFETESIEFVKAV